MGETYKGIHRYMLPERLTVEKVVDIRKQLIDTFDSGIKNYVVDFTYCKFIDSTGLGLLLSFSKKCREVGGEVKVCGINDKNVEKIFELTRLNKVFGIYQSYDKALETF